jgi:hypothetical protein
VWQLKPENDPASLNGAMPDRPGVALVSFAGQASHEELGWFKLNCLYFARI